jgi:hypothetical protein
MLAENEIHREALLCFRRLVEPEAHLRNISSHLGVEEVWGVFVSRNGFTKPVARLTGELIDAFTRNDWLERDSSDRVHLSQTGLMWYRRVTSPDPYRSQHQDRARQQIDKRTAGEQLVEVNRSESPLTWLRARHDSHGNPLLSDAQFEAGERLRRDFERAQMRAHVTANWDFGVSTRRSALSAQDRSEISDVALAAKQRFHQALDAIGPELAAVLVEVCCFLNGMAGAERSLGLPKRAGKVVLTIALNALARHYGLIETPPSAQTNSRHWGAEGYRPSIT